MILRVIDTLASSMLFTEIHISTDDEITYDLVSMHGYRPKFKRPNAIADDHAPLSLVTDYVVNQYNEAYSLSFDEVWVILPCSPFIGFDDLQQISALLMSYHDPIMTMARYNVPSQWAYRVDRDGYLQPLDPNALSKRSQDLFETFYETGNIIAYPGHLVGSKELLRYRPYIINKYRSIDIDNDEDWAQAEAFFRCFSSI